jgi:thiosulfate sulfurtransferase
MPVFKTINAAEAESLLDTNNPTILDCRKIVDYREGHIENAMLLHEQLRDSLLKKGDKDKAVLIYCYHGHASEHMAEIFCDFGFKQVYSLGGGYAGWEEYRRNKSNLASAAG